MKKRRMLLLGASGYLGAQIFHELQQDADNEIVGTCYSAPPTGEQLVQVDVTHPAAFAALLADFAPEIVIWALMSATDEHALITEGLDILQAHLPPKSRVIFISSDGIFGQGTGAFAEEDQPLMLSERNPLARYSRAKSLGEELVRQRREQHVIVRIGPLYGCNSLGKWDKRAATIRQELAAGRPITRTSNLFKTFLHVQDAAQAIKELADSSFVGTLHLGPAQKESYYSFAVTLAKALGLDSRLVTEDRLDAEEAREKGIPLDTSLNTGRANALLRTRFRQVGEAACSAAKETERH
ncbi:sugar nucleotide-binding protein [Brevibacillus parabrevis]|uniref:sugar nucleotide-binding protein n=1 Tax=Brevibacillus parabrevis TaxID=54914 RepID=UPI0028537091|nr:sugar nucleotide-binding protein [Brevibacillus parabrevis]MDR5002001.1 sugar nucleotide-binding protein [Brevibacillus parabrevis]